MRTSARLRPLLQHLPFPLDDTERLNHVYTRWARSRALPDREIVDLWTYCFTWRYFLSKAARSSLRQPSDMDALIARSIRRTCRTRHDATAIVRYASWVSVVCRNTFVNYAKRSRAVASIDDVRGFAVSEPAPTYNDAPRIRRVLLGAIRRLPAYLQDTARLFFVDGCSFETIATTTGKSIPTVRTYKSRALNQLRQDPALRQISESITRST